MEKAKFKVGHVAIVGRPNVGKSTLLNALIERKVSIVTPKPQTTRAKIVGVLTRPDFQIAFIDTPGLRDRAEKAINRAMNRVAAGSVEGADAVLLVIEALRWTAGDTAVLRRLEHSGAPDTIVLVVNKIDRVTPKEKLLPFLESVATKVEAVDIVPVSARTRSNLPRLIELIVDRLPEGPQLYPADFTSDRSEVFQAGEVIREKLMLRLQQELPYGLAVEIERYEEERGRLFISALIWVERSSQKLIVIGRGGRLLKEIGQAARLELKRMTAKSVHLELWVKVKPRWANDEQALRELGYQGP